MTHGFTTEAYPAGAHICYLYHDDEERRRVDSTFVTRGLAAGETIAYLADPSKERLGGILPKLGMPPLSKAERNRLVVESAPSICVRHNRFVPAKLLTRLRDQYEIGRTRGNKGARLIGEMSWAARGVRGSNQLVEYESQLDSFLATHPMTVLCQYDMRIFDSATIFGTLRLPAHPLLIVRGQVIQNPY